MRAGAVIESQVQGGGPCELGHQKHYTDCQSKRPKEWMWETFLLANWYSERRGLKGEGHRKERERVLIDSE